MADNATLSDAQLEESSRRLGEFWDTFSETTVDKFRDLASPDVHYRGPTIDVTGIENAIAYLRGMFKNAEQIRFETLGHARDGHTTYAQWILRFRAKKGPKNLIELPGVTVARLDEQGRLVETIDYWDSAPLLAGFPVLGHVVGLIKRIMSSAN